MIGTRLVANQIDRATWRNTIMYRLHPQLQLGAEYNPLEAEVSPLANVLLLTETENRPAIMAGTSSDRIGTPDGQSYYLTISKDLREWTGLPVAPYAGVAHGTFDDRTRAIGGFSVSFTRDISSLVIFDGVRVHPTISYRLNDHLFSLLLVGGTDPGISYSLSF